MEEIFARAWHDIFGRMSGPGNFRLIVQPIVAIILAIRSGINDARNGRPPFLWCLLFDSHQRQYFLTHGWKDINRVFFMAGILDVIFQIFVFKWVYPLETLIVAIALSIFPYLLVRGPVNRLTRMITRS